MHNHNPFFGYSLTVGDTPGNPFLIYTAEDLEKYISITGHLQRYYRLENDIDCSGQDFTRIEKFYGVLDGNGYTLSNFNISQSYTIYPAESGDYYHVSWIRDNYGTIKDIYFKNAVCSDIDIEESRRDVGFLTWRNYGTIERLMIDGNLELYGNTFNFVYSFINYGTISNCWSDVYAYNYTGGDETVEAAGFIYWNYGTITNSGYSGRSFNYSPTLVNSIYRYGNTKNCPIYSDFGTITGFYYYDPSAPDVGTWVDENPGTSLSDMALQATYDGWDFDSVWVMDEYYGHPVLQQFVLTRDDTILGDGTEESPFLIDTIEKLQQMTYHNVNANFEIIGYYKLTAQIDASNTLYWRCGNGFLPIGVRPESESQEFNSCNDIDFNGDGYTIDSLHFARRSDGVTSRGAGIFYNVDRYSSVHDFAVTNVFGYYYHERDNDGILCYGFGISLNGGANFNRIYLHGSAIIRDDGMISGCGIIANSSYNLDINDCKIELFISGNNGYAESIRCGLVGDGDSTAYIRRCLNISQTNVSSSYNAPMDGQNRAAADHYIDCYYDEDVLAPDFALTQATGLTTANAKLQESYSNWDFDTVWTIDGDYPYLRVIR